MLVIVALIFFFLELFKVAGCKSILAAIYYNLVLCFGRCICMGDK